MKTIYDKDGFWVVAYGDGEHGIAGPRLTLNGESEVTPEVARDLGLALCRWAGEHGKPLVFANLPAEWHAAARKAGLVQVKRTDQLEATVRFTQDLEDP